jgi:hypothetical protein
MRRPVIPVVLFGLGFLLLGAGLLARYYVFPTMAVLPIDRYEQTESRATDATYVDQTTGAQHTDRDLIAINTIRGDVKSNYEDTTVWDSKTVTRDAESGAEVNVYETVVAMDRHTGEAQSCCGQSIEGVGYLPRSGIAYQWPFFTEKTSYPYYDEALRKTYPITYRGTEDLYGLSVYRFVQKIDPTRLGPQPIPASMVGKPGTGMMDAERWYAIERTFWVEPRTGIVVKAADNRRETLRVDGADALTLFEANMVLSEKDSRRIVDEAADARTKIGLLYYGAFWAGLLAGLLLIALAGLLLLRRRRVQRKPAKTSEAAQVPAPVP